MNHEPGPEHHPVGVADRRRPPPGRPAGRPGRARPTTTSPVGGRDLDLAADRRDRASGSAGSSPRTVGGDVQRRQRHRQHPALGAEQPADPVEALRRGRRAAPRARRSAGCRRRGRASRPRRRTGAGATCAQVRPHSSSPHSAASAIRRSPGGSTPNSPRSRPDEPPLSATVTTAVERRRIDVAQRRQRGGRPWPPPRATTGRRRSPPARHAHSRPRSRWTARASMPALAQPAGDLLGHRDAAVLAAGAADGDRS